MSNFLINGFAQPGLYHVRSLDGGGLQNYIPGGSGPTREHGGPGVFESGNKQFYHNFALQYSGTYSFHTTADGSGSPIDPLTQPIAHDQSIIQSAILDDGQVITVGSIIEINLTAGVVDTDGDGIPDALPLIPYEAVVVDLLQIDNAAAQFVILGPLHYDQATGHPVPQPGAAHDWFAETDIPNLLAPDYQIGTSSGKVYWEQHAGTLDNQTGQVLPGSSNASFALMSTNVLSNQSGPNWVPIDSHQSANIQFVDSFDPNGQGAMPLSAFAGADPNITYYAASVFTDVGNVLRPWNYDQYGLYLKIENAANTAESIESYNIWFADDGNSAVILFEIDPTTVFGGAADVGDVMTANFHWHDDLQQRVYPLTPSIGGVLTNTSRSTLNIDEIWNPGYWTAESYNLTGGAFIVKGDTIQLDVTNVVNWQNKEFALSADDGSYGINLEPFMSMTAPNGAGIITFDTSIIAEPFLSRMDNTHRARLTVFLSVFNAGDDPMVDHHEGRLIGQLFRDESAFNFYDTQIQGGITRPTVSLLGSLYGTTDDIDQSPQNSYQTISGGYILSALKNLPDGGLDQSAQFADIPLPLRLKIPLRFPTSNATLDTNLLTLSIGTTGSPEDQAGVEVAGFGEYLGSQHVLDSDLAFHQLPNRDAPDFESFYGSAGYFWNSAQGDIIVTIDSLDTLLSMQAMWGRSGGVIVANYNGIETSWWCSADADGDGAGNLYDIAELDDQVGENILGYTSVGFFTQNLTAFTDGNASTPSSLTLSVTEESAFQGMIPNNTGVDNWTISPPEADVQGNALTNVGWAPSRQRKVFIYFPQLSGSAVTLDPARFRVQMYGDSFSAQILTVGTKSFPLGSASYQYFVGATLHYAEVLITCNSVDKPSVLTFGYENNSGTIVYASQQHSPWLLHGDGYSYDPNTFTLADVQSQINSNNTIGDNNMSYITTTELSSSAFELKTVYDAGGSTPKLAIGAFSVQSAPGWLPDFFALFHVGDSVFDGPVARQKSDWSQNFSDASGGTANFSGFEVSAEEAALLTSSTYGDAGPSIQNATVAIYASAYSAISITNLLDENDGCHMPRGPGFEQTHTLRPDASYLEGLTFINNDGSFTSTTDLRLLTDNDLASLTPSSFSDIEPLRPYMGSSEISSYEGASDEAAKLAILQGVHGNLVVGGNYMEMVDDGNGALVAATVQQGNMMSAMADMLADIQAGSLTSGYEMTGAEFAENSMEDARQLRQMLAAGDFDLTSASASFGDNRSSVISMLNHARDHQDDIQLALGMVDGDTSFEDLDKVRVTSAYKSQLQGDINSSDPAKTEAEINEIQAALFQHADSDFDTPPVWAQDYSQSGVSGALALKISELNSIVPTLISGVVVLDNSGAKVVRSGTIFDGDMDLRELTTRLDVEHMRQKAVDEDIHALLGPDAADGVTSFTTLGKIKDFLTSSELGVETEGAYPGGTISNPGDIDPDTTDSDAELAASYGQLKAYATPSQRSTFSAAQSETEEKAALVAIFDGLVIGDVKMVWNDSSNEGEETTTLIDKAGSVLANSAARDHVQGALEALDDRSIEHALSIAEAQVDILELASEMDMTLGTGSLSDGSRVGLIWYPDSEGVSDIPAEVAAVPGVSLLEHGSSITTTMTLRGAIEVVDTAQMAVRDGLSDVFAQIGSVSGNEDLKDAGLDSRYAGDTLIQCLNEIKEWEKQELVARPSMVFVLAADATGGESNVEEDLLDPSTVFGGVQGFAWWIKSAGQRVQHVGFNIADADFNSDGVDDSRGDYKITIPAGSPCPSVDGVPDATAVGLQQSYNEAVGLGVMTQSELDALIADSSNSVNTGEEDAPGIFVTDVDTTVHLAIIAENEILDADVNVINRHIYQIGTGGHIQDEVVKLNQVVTDLAAFVLTPLNMGGMGLASAGKAYVYKNSVLQGIVTKGTYQPVCPQSTHVPRDMIHVQRYAEFDSAIDAIIGAKGESVIPS